MCTYSDTPNRWLPDVGLQFSDTEWNQSANLLKCFIDRSDVTTLGTNSEKFTTRKNAVSSEVSKAQNS